MLTPAAPAGYTLTGAQTFVYVVSQNSTTGFGDISAFSVASSGALTPLPCSSSTSACDTTGNGGFLAGTAPSAIASTPLGHYLYITDSARNQLLSFGLQSVIPNPQSAPTTIQYTGQLIALQNSPISADAQPDAVTVDPSGNYVYVANYAANDISAYSINPVPANAAPNNAVPLSTGLSPNGTYGTGTGPTCVLVDPALGGYVYTTNFIDNTVSGLNIESKGVLAPVQNTPFAAAGQPTCIAATVYGKVPPITSTN